MAKVFITGATGYVGGDALYHLSSAPANYDISALVRDSEKASVVQAAFPHIRVVQGDLDDANLIEEEAKKADIVLNLAATNHVTSANAIAKSLNNAGKPVYWIQMSGATLFAADEIANRRFGQKSNKVYNDLEGVSEIFSVISDSPSRTVDNLIIRQDPSKVKTALLIGPLIYGVGRGPGNQRSVQAPEIARVTLKNKEGFKLEAGENSWSNIHVHDLSDLCLKLVEAAASGENGVWNQEGIYCPENGATEFGKLSGGIAAEAAKQGLIPDGTVKKTISGDEADAQSGHASILWGTNAVQKSSRARTKLNWQPSEVSLVEEIPNIVRIESEA
ncbi:hypothetical protein BP6252_14015 [Coleophoma cylindrospora]|uniref:Semialdehyde dehydrogenase NAD-binding domain-containing protein n=1 Tax=Coleophoma cylindrospora TaxID=1849047 RepID=A0A3D8Q4I0_9HELO|nr:hypothetical protein BP6252_14015 [Coleophoma cylindrospora]